jgi:uncharacterized protein
VVLLLAGLAHLPLLWNGDILTEYALSGLLVLPMLRARTGALLPFAAVLYTVSLLFPLSPWAPAFPDDAALMREASDALRIYGEGTYAQVRAYGLHEWRLFSPMYYSVFTVTPALMLVGMATWRSGLWRDRAALARPIAVVAASGMAGGLLLTVLAADEVRATAPLLAYLAGSLAPLAMAAGYCALVLVLLDAGILRALFAFVAPAGRMAFTNYLTQSAVFALVFYGYGLGLIGEVGATAACVAGIGLFALQCAASRAWLARFRFGPLEWAWRSLTYGKRQGFRRERH